MSKTTWIVLGVVGVGVVGVIIYLMTRGSSGGRMMGDGAGAGGEASGIVASIGAGLTGIAATITGAAERQQERDRLERERADGAAS